GKRHDDEVAALYVANILADVFDDADRFVSHDNPGLARLHSFIWPEVAAANAGTSDSDECVGRVDNARVGHVVDPNITGLIHNHYFHDLILLVLMLVKLYCSDFPGIVLRSRAA